MAEKFGIKAAKNGDFSKQMRLCKMSNDRISFLHSQKMFNRIKE